MSLLESLPTVIGTAAVAPALLILWLVVAAGERPGPPLKVWSAFALGAASILLLGIIRAPFANLFGAPADPWLAHARGGPRPPVPAPPRAPFAILRGAPADPWLAQAQHAIFGVALPEETVK